jgi:hypothetical protein
MYKGKATYFMEQYVDVKSGTALKSMKEDIRPISQLSYCILVNKTNWYRNTFFFITSKPIKNEESNNQNL